MKGLCDTNADEAHHNTDTHTIQIDSVGIFDGYECLKDILHDEF